MTQKKTTTAQKPKMSHRLAAAVTMGALAGSHTMAQAAGKLTDFNTLTNNISTATDNFTLMMQLLGYIGGSGMAIAGIYKLKQHVDGPANHPLKDGLMRLATGGALLSLPLVVRVIQGSVNNGSAANTGVTKLNTFTLAAGG